MNDTDFIGAGFRQLDEHLVPRRPPKIRWGRLYKDMNEEQKIAYLEKLCASMNEAAALVQDERNQLTVLCEMKEEQIGKMNAAIRQNNDMLQAEITRMNEDRQLFHAEIARLKQRIRELEQSNGDLD